MPLKLFAGLFVLFAFSQGASAAIWNWGCQGQLADQTVVFNRERLYVVPGKPARGEIRKVITDKIEKLDEKDKDDAYAEQSGNEGLEGPLPFERGNEVKYKVVLTRESTKRTSHRSRLICGRDEIIDTFNNVYRFERTGETAQSIKMQCFEYTLSTRGGRPCN